MNYSLKDMNEAESKKARICVLYKSLSAEIVASQYSDVGLVNIKGVSSDLVLKALSDGRCAGAVIPINDWDVLKNSQQINPSKICFPIK